MSTYRDILYGNYSASFEGQKAFDADMQHEQYEATYAHLPSDRSSSVVDLGCGKGEWIAWISTKGFTQLTGVDLSPSDLAIAQKNDPDRRWVEENVVTFLESHTAAFDLRHDRNEAFAQQIRREVAVSIGRRLNRPAFMAYRIGQWHRRWLSGCVFVDEEPHSRYRSPQRLVPASQPVLNAA